MPSDDPGASALAAIEAALARQPLKDDHLLSEAMKNLTALRDMLSRSLRGADATESARQRLRLVNGVIATVFACHYPLGKVPWEELSDARDQLRASLADV